MKEKMAVFKTAILFIVLLEKSSNGGIIPQQLLL